MKIYGCKLRKIKYICRLKAPFILMEQEELHPLDPEKLYYSMDERKLSSF